MQSQDLVKNRILRQLSADELKACSHGSRPWSFDQMPCSTSRETQSSRCIFLLAAWSPTKCARWWKRVAGTGAQAAVDPQIAIMPPLTEGQNRVWGPERIQIYNDANRAFMGTKHPGALGRPGREDGARYGRRTRRGTSVPPDQDP